MNLFPALFALAFLACLFLANKPLQGHTKWHGLVGALFCFAMVGVTAPNHPKERVKAEEKPTPQPTAVAARDQGVSDRPERTAPRESGVESTSQSMDFESCLANITGVATELGVAPINIVETSVVRMVRFNTTDGSVLVTCSAPDQKMVITKSPYKG